MDPTIRTDAVKLAKLGKLLSSAAVVIESLEASEAQVVQLKQGIIDLGGIKKALEAEIQEKQGKLASIQEETKATIEAAKVNSEGVLVAAKAEAEKILGDAKAVREEAVAKAGAILGEAVKRQDLANAECVAKAKELQALEAKIDKLKAAAKTFAGV